ncbi:uncharacterized protein [Lolium perenne]|uniref:uncharacterized protein n=1 Tax=Lolium perenne TaxID=4522 RepID=UPI0021EA2D5A
MVAPVVLLRGRMSAARFPTKLGGLGVLDIKGMSWALCARWLCLGHTDTTKPWANFPIKCNRNINSLVHAATIVKLGNGYRACSGRSLACRAKYFRLGTVNVRASKNQKVAAALPVNAWIQDNSDAVPADGIIQFHHLD